MKRNKKILLPVVIAAVVLLAFFGGRAIKEATTRVNVYPVSMVDAGFFEDQLSMDASVYDMDTQSVYLNSAQTVSEVYVTEGQTVQAGDKLMAYDMTSQNIAVKLKELDIESAKKSLQKAQKDLADLKAGRSIASAGSDSGLLFTSAVSKTAQGVDVAPLYSAPGKPGKSQQGDAWNYLDGGSLPDFYNTDSSANDPAGSEQNPLKYLVQEDGVVYGSFFNAFSEREDQYALIEVREGDVRTGRLISSWMLYSGQLSSRDPLAAWSVMTHERIAEDPEEGEGPEEPEDDNIYDSGDFDPGSGFTAADRAKALREKEAEVKQCDLDLRKAQLELKQMQDQVVNGVVLAKKDGVVTVVHSKDDPPQDGSAFLKVSSGTGVYMKGSVSELLLDQVKEDALVTATDMETGESYTGKITSVDDYPLSDNYGYYGGNPNASYYGFLAYFEDASDIRPDTWIELRLGGEEMGMDEEYEEDDPDGEGSYTEPDLYLPRAYIRTADNRSYVMKEENGVLVRQTVQCGKTYYGEVTQILDGISREDYIAFPYGPGAKAGARTQETDSMEGIW